MSGSQRGDRLSNRVAAFGTLAMWLHAPPIDLFVIFNDQLTLITYVTPLYGKYYKKKK